jgi:hypothetical protein
VSGKVGAAYSQTLSAVGGLAPYVWVGTGLPPGLILHQDGTLSGVPTKAGKYTLSISAIDDSAPTQIIDASWPLLIQ